MRLKSRLQKLERGKADSMVIIVQGPGEDIDTLMLERFGPGGHPSNVSLIVVKTGVPRADGKRTWH